MFGKFIKKDLKPNFFCNNVIDKKRVYIQSLVLLNLILNNGE